MYSVYQHWDPLEVCVVGRSYPPEFYDWVERPHVRRLMERIAVETEEDYQQIIKILESFGVEIIRMELPEQPFQQGRFLAPPMNPRDDAVMIGSTLYHGLTGFHNFYSSVRQPHWPQWAVRIEDLDPDQQRFCLDQGWSSVIQSCEIPWRPVFERVRSQGNHIRQTKFFQHTPNMVNGAMVSRIGRDLYFGTESYSQDLVEYQRYLDQEFQHTRNHIVNTGGHGDGTYCPVCPGLIVSVRDVPTYRETFPGWEVVWLEHQGFEAIPEFMGQKSPVSHKWWIPGFDNDPEVVHCIEQWFDHWMGYVAETVFDVNMLIIDPKNVMVFSENDLVFDAFHRYGITPHVVPFRHRFFWDGGIHCVTLDLARRGHMQDWFPDRG